MRKFARTLVLQFVTKKESRDYRVISKIRCLNIFRSERLPEAQRSANVHTVPNTGIRKGISLQSLFDATTANRNRACTLPDGTTDQDLVPESANEIEKGIKGGQRNQRASQTRARGARYDEETAGGETGQVAAGAAERRPPASAAASRKRPGKNAKRSSEGSQ